jgi:hypothetical protein
MIDFATVIPIWITYYCFDNPIDVEEVTNFADALNYILHGAYTLRILRVLRVHKTLNLIEDEVHRFLWQLGLSVITMILFGLTPFPSDCSSDQLHDRRCDHPIPREALL